jgi:hypothetical protein
MHRLYIAGQVPTGARAQVSERGTEKRAMCDLASHAAILSVHSVWLSCNSRTGSAEGTQRGDASRRRWVARRDERLCIISDSVGYLLYPCRAPHILNVLYWAPVVTVFWKGSKLASPRQVLYYDTTIRHDSDELQAVE